MGNLLLWLQEHIKHWTRPATPPTVSGILSDLTRSRSDLIAENAFLRQQLIVLNRQIKRPQLTNPDRFRLVFLAHLTKFWKQALHIVQPDTLLRWHRELFRSYWRRKSQGKPKISPKIITLIRKMAGGESVVGSGANSGRIVEAGDSSEQTNHSEIHAERQEITCCEPNLEYFPEESSRCHMGLRLYRCV